MTNGFTLEAFGVDTVFETPIAGLVLKTVQLTLVRMLTYPQSTARLRRELHVRH